MRLTREEIMLLTGILSALVLGASVRAWRDARRLHLVPSDQPTPTSVPHNAPE